MFNQIIWLASHDTDYREIVNTLLFIAHPKTAKIVCLVNAPNFSCIQISATIIEIN